MPPLTLHERLDCDFCVVVAVAVAVVVAVALMPTFPWETHAKLTSVALQVAREGRMGGVFPIKPLRGATFDFT